MPINTDGTMEGKFAIPVPEMITVLNALLGREYGSWLTYTHYASILRQADREAVVPMFREHATEELGHAEKLVRRIVTLGGITTVEVHPVPQAAELPDMISNLVSQEQEALALYRQALPKCGENEGTKQMIETIIEQEQEHADELWLLIPRSADVVAEWVDAKLQKMLEAPTCLAAISAERLTELTERLSRAVEFAVHLLDQNPKRTVYDVERDGASICRVVRMTDKWECNCPGHVVGVCTHIPIVQSWEAGGRRGEWADAAHEFKRFMDSLSGKGPPKGLRQVMHRRLPRIRKGVPPSA